MATLENGRLIYAPTPAPKKIKKGAIPKFLQLATSSHDTATQEDTQVIEKEQVRESMEHISKLHPSIDPQKEPDVWDEDEGS
jgi:hypothetical protein